MGFAARALSESVADAAENWGPLDDRWYAPLGSFGTSLSGEAVTADSALAIPAVWACATVIAETVASLPLIVYRRRSDGGKERAKDHPAYDLLHDVTSPLQTSFEWRESSMYPLLLRGNGPNEVRWDTRGIRAGIVPAEIMPLDPDRVTVELLRDGRTLKYTLSEADGRKREIAPENMLWFKGRSMSPYMGMSVIAYARDTFGLAKSYQRSASRWLKNGGNPSMVLQRSMRDMKTTALSKEARGRLQKEAEEVIAGADNHGRVLVVDEGFEAKPITISNADSQWLEAIGANSIDVTRFFRMPPHMIGDLTRATFSNIEHQSLDFVVHTIRPWLVRLEQRINAFFFGNDREHFCEFLVDGLLRGDSQSRANFYQKLVLAGVMEPNEARIMENWNPLPDGSGLRRAANLGQTDGSQTPRQAPANSTGRAAAIIEAVAQRCVTREVSAIRRAVAKGGSLAAVYADHAAYLVAALSLEPETARAYCARRQAEYEAEGVAGDHVDLFELAMLEG